MPIFVSYNCQPTGIVPLPFRCGICPAFSCKLHRYQTSSGGEAMNPFGIFVCILWGTVALFSVLSFVTVVHNNRRNLKRAQAVVIGKNVSPSGRTSTARASDAKTDYIILFSIGGVTRSLFAGQALYTDLQVGDHGTLSYRDGRVVGFTRAA